MYDGDTAGRGFATARRLRGNEEIAGAFRDMAVDCVQLGRGEDDVLHVSLHAVAATLRATSGSGVRRLEGAIPRGRLHLQVDLGSQGERRLGARPIGRGEIAIWGGGADSVLVSAERQRTMGVTLEEDEVRRALDARGAPGGGLLRPSGLSLLALDDAALALVRTLAGAALFQPEAHVGASGAEFAAASMVDALFDAVVQSWGLDREAARCASYQRMPVVRKAEDYMRAHLGEPIMLADICRAARASARTLQYAFADVYGMGAKSYLRLVRLNAVRDDLLGREASGMTIEGIIARRGLWHMGHFSAAYRRLYGETARTTARRRPGAD